LKALCIGELTVDWLSLEHGESMMSARQFYRYLGGNASNVAVGLSRLKLRSAVISSVGQDIHGEYLLKGLKDEGVDTSFVKLDPEQPTAQCYMTRREDGFPDYYSWPSPNASKNLRPEDIDNRCFDDAWILHGAGVSFIAKPRRYAMEHAVNEACRRQIIISFDACFPLVESEGGRQTAFAAMKKSDILKFNLAELIYWSGMSADSSIEEMLQAINKECKPALLAVTLAEKGAILFCKNESVFCPPYIVKSLGDVGPGDAFSAGLIYGLSKLSPSGMKRDSLYELGLQDWLGISRYASCAGAMVTRSYSATESFPGVDELELALGKTTPGS
jgi:sugar/nucleoside kinase (ribokinase family)